MTGFLFLTAFTVSIDSFACGFSLSFYAKDKGKLIIVSVIAVTVLIMCVAANYAAYALYPIPNDCATVLGGLLLIGIGVFNLFKKEESAKPADRENGKIFKQSLLAGVAVGLDGAAANLSLSVMGINEFYVPVVIALMHAAMIAFGIALSKLPFIKKASRLKFIPPLVLIFLGLYKLIPLVVQ